MTAHVSAFRTDLSGKTESPVLGVGQDVFNIFESFFELFL
jgi:hypothetical protein